MVFTEDYLLLPNPADFEEAVDHGIHLIWNF